MTRWLLSLCILLCMYACRKDKVEVFDYSIQGVDKVTSNIGETKVIDLNITNISGFPEEVVLSLKNVPNGVSYVFNIDKGRPDFKTSLTLKITSDASLGDHSLNLEAVSATTKKIIPIELLIDDQLSLSVAVYDATKWNSELPWGLLSDSCSVSLFSNEDDFLNGKPAYSGKTNTDGKVLFYRISPGNYLYLVEKESLSNIAEKISLGGKKMGYVTAGIFKTKNEVYSSSQPNAQPGKLKYRDQNSDGKITDDDRMPYDEVSIYEGVLNEKITWIGK